MRAVVLQAGVATNRDSDNPPGVSDWTGTTGSAAGDVAACPPRMAFPQCRTSSSAADRGVELHRFAEMCTRFPDRRDEFLKEMSEEWRLTAVSMDLANAHAELDGTLMDCEVAYVVNVKERTARRLGTNIDRDYAKFGLTKYDIPLTIDLEDTVLGGVPCEQDYKSGRYVGEPSEHFQRKLSATALMFHHGTSEAVSRICYIWEDGTTKLDGCEFTLIDAWETCDVMVTAIDRVVEAKELLAAGKVPTVYPDRERQCKYCSSFSVCPFWSNLISGAAERLATAPDFTAVPPEEKGRWMDYVKDVLKVANAVEETLKEHAKREALPVDDTWEFSMASKKGRSYFDNAAARGLLVTLLGREGMSPEDIDKKLASFNKRGIDVEEVRKRKRSLDIVKL